MKICPAVWKKLHSQDSGSINPKVLAGHLSSFMQIYVSTSMSTKFDENPSSGVGDAPTKWWTQDLEF